MGGPQLCVLCILCVRCVFCFTTAGNFVGIFIFTVVLGGVFRFVLVSVCKNNSADLRIEQHVSIITLVGSRRAQCGGRLTR